MNDTQKMEAFKALLDDPALLGEVLEGVDISEKEAESMGIAFKEYGGEDFARMSADEMLDFAIARKEAEMADAAEKAKKAEEEEEEEEEDDEGAPAAGTRTMKAQLDRMEGIVTQLGSHVEALSGDQSMKDDTLATLAETADGQNARFVKAEATIADLSKRLEVATKELAALKGDQPLATRPNGVRPTQNGSNIVETPNGVPVEAKKEAGAQDHLAGFLDNFVVGGGAQ